ncbi:MAG: hypothetical protein ACLQDV_02290 [Candidatus Binataceae bacterium]
MKKLRISWAAVSLIPPLLIVCSLFFGSLGNRHKASFAASSTPGPGATSGNIQAGFITTITGQPPAGLQNVYLNIISVRLNPKPKPGTKQGIPSENDAAWKTIPVPAGVGVGINGRPGDLQLDMLAGQNKFQLFNTAGIRPNTYSSVEVVLDATTPGNIVPICSSGGGSIEGCANYPIALEGQGAELTFIAPNQVVVARNTLTQLPLQLNLNIVNKPSGPDEPYTATVTAGPAPGNASQFLATVSGTITGANGNATVKKVRHLSVTAELAGTNTIVATSNVVNSQYNLFVPAAADLGTLYDFFVTGGSATLAGVRGITAGANGGLVFPAQAYTQNFTVEGDQTLGTIGGTITDFCKSLPIQGAVLNMLMPPVGSSVDCATTPAECVSVGSTVTDNSGKYPLPGTFQNPAYFNNIPIGDPPITYTIQVTAPGYDSQIFEAQASGTNSGTNGGVCSSSTDAPTCNFALTTSYITGVVQLAAAPQPGNSASIQVFAEESGTNSLVSALTLPLIIPGAQSSASFTLNVPSKMASFDLFASAADFFQTASAGTAVINTDPYPGHTIITQAGVPNASGACDTSSPPGLFTEMMECSGHGSIAGTAANPDSGTTVELSKNHVQLMQAAVGPATPAPSVGNSYSFCAPPDTYEVQRLEAGVPVGAAAAVLAMPTPMATSSPCPSTCFSASGICPGLCANTIQSPL